MKQRRIRYIVIGKGEECNQCGQVMERRKHNERPNKSWFYEQWDICKNQSCPKTVQHYEEFKSSDWKEVERQNNFFDSI